MNTNPLAVTRKIRACEGEVAAQLLLEEYVASAVDDALERAAKEGEHWQTRSTNPGHACGQYIASAIRGMKRAR